MTTSGSNRLLDEFAKLITDAAGAAQGVRREAENVVKGQLERLMNTMDVVQREEFEAVREMAAKAREENIRLSARLAELEAKLSSSGAGSGPAVAATAATGDLGAGGTTAATGPTAPTSRRRTPPKK